MVSGSVVLGSMVRQTNIMARKPMVKKSGSPYTEQKRSREGD